MTMAESAVDRRSREFALLRHPTRASAMHVNGTRDFAPFRDT